MLKIRSLFFASIFASTLVGGWAVKAETLPIATTQAPAPFAAQPANRYWNLRQTPITDVVRKFVAQWLTSKAKNLQALMTFL